jgi:hypothetical protein
MRRYKMVTGVMALPYTSMVGKHSVVKLAQEHQIRETMIGPYSNRNNVMNIQVRFIHASGNLAVFPVTSMYILSPCVPIRRIILQKVASWIHLKHFRKW